MLVARHKIMDFWLMMNFYLYLYIIEHPKKKKKKDLVNSFILAILKK